MPTNIILKPFILAVMITFLPVYHAAAKIDLVTLQDQQSVQTTIYNKADLTLVRDKRMLNFVKGENYLQFSWANTKIDPTSLSLEIKKEKGSLEVVEITYPPGTREEGIWRINAQKACRVPIEISYFTSGISWKSYYIATLSKDTKTCDLKGYVKVSNLSGEDYDNAQTRLVLGQIHILDQIADLASRQYPYDRPEHFLMNHELETVYDKRAKTLKFAKTAMTMESKVAGQRAGQITKQGFSEYFLYTIEGKESISHGWAKRLLSFHASDIKIKTIYKYEYHRFGENVVRFITFKNDKKNNLGQTPMPQGTIKVFQNTGKKGELNFIGSDTGKYIPVGKKVELNLGSAREVKIVPKVMAYKKTNIFFDDKGNINGFDEVKECKVELSNFTDSPSDMEYIKNLDSNYFKITGISHPDQFKQTDQDTIQFTIRLAPHSNENIYFTLETRRGERRWQQ